MAHGDPLAFVFPDITDPEALRVFVETFVAARSLRIEAESESGEALLFPGVLLPDSPIRDAEDVSAFFAVARENGKEPWLLVVLQQTDGLAYRFRLGAASHGWGYGALERGAFLIVRDANDSRAVGVPCPRRGDDPDIDRTIGVYEAAACRWLEAHGTHPAGAGDAEDAVPDGALLLITDAAGIARFKREFPLYKVGAASVALAEGGEHFDLPIVYVPEGRSLPEAFQDTDTQTTYFLGIEGGMEPTLGIHIEIEGVAEPFRFGVPGRQMAWIVAVTLGGSYGVQAEAVLEGKAERRFEPDQRWRTCLTLAVPPVGSNPANDRVLAEFLKRAADWRTRQQRTH